MASSLIYPGEHIIDDSTIAPHVLVPGGMGRGLDYSTRTEEGYAGAADPFPDDWLIPESEWEARIKEMEDTKSRVSDLVIQAGLPPKNQEQTPYCWINAVTHLLEVERVVANEPMVILSPASAGAQIKNFRAVGGWGREGIEWVSDHGVDPVSVWPPNAIDRRYCTPEAKEAALKYRFNRWFFTDNSLKQIMSCLLRRKPLAAGLAWWSHEILFCDPVWIDGAPAIRFRNSWGPDWPKPGAGGWSILQGRRMYPDDTVGSLTVTAA